MYVVQGELLESTTKSINIPVKMGRCTHPESERGPTGREPWVSAVTVQKRREGAPLGGRAAGPAVSPPPGKSGAAEGGPEWNY